MVEVTEVVVTPLRPGVTAHLNITGNLPLDITAELNPTIDINVYYGTWCACVVSSLVLKSFLPPMSLALSPLCYSCQVVAIPPPLLDVHGIHP